MTFWIVTIGLLLLALLILVLPILRAQPVDKSDNRQQQNIDIAKDKKAGLLRVAAGRQFVGAGTQFPVVAAAVQGLHRGARLGPAAVVQGGEHQPVVSLGEQFQIAIAGGALGRQLDAVHGTGAVVVAAAQAPPSVGVHPQRSACRPAQTRAQDRHGAAVAVELLKGGEQRPVGSCRFRKRSGEVLC